MRIIEQQSTGGADVLRLTETDTPRPAKGEVLVRVGAIGVNPVDAAVRAGYWPLLGEPPFVLGWDVAGTVDALGENVTDLTVGDRVFGLIRFPEAGNAYAEYVVAPASELAPTPSGLDDVHAAAIPLAGLTAWKALVEEGAVRAGERVLIHAAGGGVGHFAVQIAKARGAYVVATASTEKADFVRALGADEVIDYTAGDFAAELEPVDLAIDPLGGELTARTVAVLRDRGRLVSLLPGNEDAVHEEVERRGIRHSTISVTASRSALLELAALVNAGGLAPTVSATFPLERAADAHEALARSPKGKVVLRTDSRA